VFGAAAAMSPSLWWADGAIVTFVNDHPPKQRPRLWIDTDVPAEGGDADGDAVTESRLAQQLLPILDKQGYDRSTDLHYEALRGGRHHETDWAARFDRVVLFLLGDKVPAAASQP
jgi:predicted alpha/beta superfamily hydrolase